jgi:hypothetical protein
MVSQKNKPEDEDETKINVKLHHLFALIIFPLLLLFEEARRFHYAF